MDRIIEFLIKLIVWFSGFTKALSRIGIGRYEEWKPGSKIKLLLVGYNGARNTGADVRVIEIARQILDLFGEDKVEITIVTMDVESLEGYFPDCVHLLKLSPVFLLGIYRACSVNHAVMIVEGSTLKSTFANALSMLYCESAGIMKRQGKPCLAYGTEIGTMDPWLERMAASHCDETYFITRTEPSLKRLLKMGLHGHAGTDTAWTFEGEQIQWAGEELMKNGWDGTQPVIGAAVIDPFCWPVRSSLLKWIKTALGGSKKDQYKMWYFFSRSEERTNAFEQYIQNVAAAVQDYAEKNNCFVAVIGMEALDLGPINRLKDLLTVPCCSFCATENNAFEMVGVLQNLSQLVTSRYHAAVLSMKKGIPIVSISMDERLDELMTGAGMDQEFILRTDDPKLGEHLTKALYDGDTKRDEIRGLIHNYVTGEKEIQKQMGDYLKGFLKW